MDKYLKNLVLVCLALIGASLYGAYGGLNYGCNEILITLFKCAIAERAPLATIEILSLREWHQIKSEIPSILYDVALANATEDIKNLAAATKNPMLYDAMFKYVEKTLLILSVLTSFDIDLRSLPSYEDFKQSLSNLDKTDVFAKRIKANENLKKVIDTLSAYVFSPYSVGKTKP